MSNIAQIKNIYDLEKKLSESDMVRYNKFSNQTRKLQYLVSRAIVYDACGEHIIVDENGAPTIKSGFVSVAHKDNWVLVAISNIPVGLDIENTTIKRDFIGQSELLNLPISKDKDVFYKNFVKYESIFKYGDGAVHASKYFYEMENYLICVCSNELRENIEFISSNTPIVRFICAE